MVPNWFIAWPVTGADEWLATLEAQAPGGLRFLAPADLHITLAFLGRFEPGILQKMTSLLKGLPLKALTISPDQLVALPQPRRFSALAFTLASGRNEVEAQIARWRERICREAGARIETRQALPHLTVARPERRIGLEDREATLEWLETVPSQSTAVRLELGTPRIFTWASGDAETRYQMLN